MSEVVPNSSQIEGSLEDKKAELPEGTALKVYLFLLQQSKPVGLSEVRSGVGLSTSSLASYHLDRLIAASLARKEGGGYVADRMALRGFMRFRSHLISTSLFMAGFFAMALLLLFFAPWHSRYQQVVMGAVVIFVALVYSLSRAIQSTSWLKTRAGLDKSRRLWPRLSLKRKKT